MRRTTFFRLDTFYVCTYLILFTAEMNVAWLKKIIKHSYFCVPHLLYDSTLKVLLMKRKDCCIYISWKKVGGHFKRCFMYSFFFIYFLELSFKAMDFVKSTKLIYPEENFRKDNLQPYCTYWLLHLSLHKSFQLRWYMILKVRRSDETLPLCFFLQTMYFE